MCCLEVMCLNTLGFNWQQSKGHTEALVSQIGYCFFAARQFPLFSLCNSHARILCINVLIIRNNKGCSKGKLIFLHRPVCFSKKESSYWFVFFKSIIKENGSLKIEYVTFKPQSNINLIRKMIFDILTLKSRDACKFSTIKL